MTRLFICEKPSQARDIAEVLGIAEKSNGYIKTKTQDVITWAIGHIVELAPPDHYLPDLKKSWQMDLLPVIPDNGGTNWHRIPVEKTASQFAVIKNCLAKAQSVVIATDADREGEVIGREILDVLFYKGKVERLWLSALDPESIKQALKQLRSGEKELPLYHAGLGRMYADYLIGMNLTMAMTVLAKASHGRQGVLSVGRVQTPTLALVVDRDHEIKNFVSREFYPITIQVEANTQPPAARFMMRWRMEQTQTAQGLEQGVGTEELPSSIDEGNLAANLDGAQCFDKRLATTVVEAVRAAKFGRLTNVTRERKGQIAPLLYALPSLQRDVSKQLGVTVKKVLDIAQNLYEKHKAISYPRSECEYLPFSQFEQSAALLSQLAERQPHYAAWLPLCDANKKGRVWNDKKVAESSHHAIVPTLNSQVKIDNMTADERYVYDLIVRRYFMQFMPDAQYDTAQFVADFAGHVFVANGRVLVQQGWLCAEKSAVEAKPADKKSAAQTQGVEAISLPHLEKGQTLALIQADIQPNKTKPPSPYTESTLLAAMENVSRFVTDKEIKKWLKDTAGLGTPATRGDIIETLKRREYVEIDKKALRSTEKGNALIASLRVVCPALTDPVMTARWEMALDDVAAGGMTLSDFIQFQGKFVTAMVTAIKTAPIEKMTWAAPSAQPASKSSVKSSSTARPAPTRLAATKPKEPPTGVMCSLCNHPMVKRQGSRGAFLACSAYPNCKNTRNL